MSVFDHLAVRMAIQAAIMDEIVVDGPGTYSIVVPDKLIERLDSIISPFVDASRDFPDLLAAVAAAGGAIDVSPAILLQLPRLTLNRSTDQRTGTVELKVEGLDRG